jgi:hypothetical protein
LKVDESVSKFRVEYRRLADAFDRAKRCKEKRRALQVAEKQRDWPPNSEIARSGKFLRSLFSAGGMPSWDLQGNQVLRSAPYSLLPAPCSLLPVPCLINP